MKKYLLACLLLGLHLPTSYAYDWKWRTLADLKALKNIYERNSIAPVIDSPYWQKQLKHYRQLLQKANTVHSAGGYYAILSAFASGFKDEHYAIRASDKLKTMIPTRIAQVIVIKPRLMYQALCTASLVNKSCDVDGYTLISCDGQTAKAMMLLRQQFAGNPDLKSDTVWQAPFLLTDFANPFRPAYKHCLFKKGKVTKTVQMQYQDLSFNKVSQYAASKAFTYKPIYQTKAFMSDGIWVSMPRFHFDTAKDLAEVKAVIKQAPGMRHLKTVVVDLRGNTGGNSTWGRQFLNGLYGKAFVDYQLQKSVMGKKPTYEVWRVGQASIDYLEKASMMLTKQLGSKAKTTTMINHLLQQMKKAKQLGQALYRVPNSKSKTAIKKAKPLFKGQLVVITNGQCGSSCLTYMDQLTAMPKVKVYGRATGADSIFTEYSKIPLKSGLAIAGLPLKATVNRPRGNTPFKPQIIYPGNINDTKALKEWVKEKLVHQ